MKKRFKDFPLVNKKTSYLDNASTTLKPQSVIDAVEEYYREYSVNVHRGIYALSEHASEKYEAVREQVRSLINAQHQEEIIFTSGTTHSLNLAARLLTQDLSEGDEIILTQIEHHANLIPWQIVASEKKLTLKFLELQENGELDASHLETLITDKTQILAVTHISNVSGYISPIQELTKIAHMHDVRVVVDAAQSVPHMPVDVQELDVDMLAFSGHKMCGPTGVGVLYGKRELLEQLEPVFGGGSMISEVDFDRSSWADLPLKFEPGTPNIAGVLGLGAAIGYLQNIGLANIWQHEQELSRYAAEQLSAIDGLTLYRPKNADVASGIFSFTLDGIHPHDVASVLDNEGVMVRAGHHCAQPLMKLWNVPATTRASLYFTNTTKDVDRLASGIATAQQTLGQR